MRRALSLGICSLLLGCAPKTVPNPPNIPAPQPHVPKEEPEPQVVEKPEVTSQSYAQEQHAPIQDEYEAFVTSAQSCEEARIEIDLEAIRQDIVMHTEYVMRIDGPDEDDNCYFSMQLNTLEVSYDDDLRALRLSQGASNAELDERVRHVEDALSDVKDHNIGQPLMCIYTSTTDLVNDLQSTTGSIKVACPHNETYCQIRTEHESPVYCDHLGYPDRDMIDYQGNNINISSLPKK